MRADVVCPGCGAHVVEGDRFCSHCGANLTQQAPAGDERKLVSAVVVDLAGFTALSESLDPEDTRRMLEEYWDGVRHEVERFGGTVEKYIGDAVVGVFGAPLVHEDDAERSVRAALAVRELAARPAHPDVRIGVARGLALVRGGARAETGEALVVGDVVTIATRLQQRAPRGAVLVDEATHAATRSGVVYRRLPPLQVEGKRAPLRAWRAVRLRAHAAPPSGSTRFLDRQSELALLSSVLERARDGRAVQLVTVLGEPGIGKTRLVRELPLLDMARFEARALPYGEQAPLAPLAELLRSLLGAGELPQRVEELLVVTIPDPEERSRIGARVRRLVQADAEAPASSGGPLEGFAAWRRLIEAAATRHPLVLVFEDVHWADDALLDFLEHLVEWASPVPLLVLCTARPDLLRRRSTWAGGRANALTVSLGPLSGDDTATLLADVLGSVPAPDEAAALVARSGGNPLYAEQLARMVREDAPAGDAVPDTLQAVIAARLDRLPPAAKQVLTDASVAGLNFAAAALQAIGLREAPELDATLHELERMDLLVRREHDGEWAFRHRLVREVAYSQLPHAARADGHEAVAGWLEQHRSDEASELIAHHLVRAREETMACGGQGEELGLRALAALEHAGRRALALGAFASASRLFEQALDLCPADDARRPRLLLSYARALWDAEVAGQAAALEARDGLLATGDRDGAAAASALLSEMRWYRGDREAAFSYLDEAVALARGRPGSPEHALVLARLARTQMLAADYDAALVSGREALALAEQLGDVELQAEALNSIGSARVRRGDEEGFGDLERALGLAAGTRAAVVAYNNLGALLAESGRRDASDDALDQGRALAEQLGDRLHIEWFDAERIGRRARDDWDGALAAADEWLGSHHHLAYPGIGVRATRALLRHARGDSSGALADVAEIEREARAAGDPQTLIPTLAGAAFILLEEGDVDAARARAEEAIAGCDATGDISPLAAVDLSLVAGAVGLGDAAMAVLSRAPQTNVYRGTAAAYLAGDLEGAAAQLERLGADWQAAYIRLRLAERGEGDPAPALAYYRRVGADRYTARAEAVAAGHMLAVSA